MEPVLLIEGPNGGIVRRSSRDRDPKIEGSAYFVLIDDAVTEFGSEERYVQGRERVRAGDVENLSGAHCPQLALGPEDGRGTLQSPKIQ